MAVQKKIIDKREPGRLIQTLGALVEATVHVPPLLVILGGAGCGLVYLWQESEAGAAYRIRPAVEVSQRPGVRPEAVREFQRLGAQAVGRSLLDPMLLRDLREKYRRSPWVREICTMRRVFPNQLCVEFIPREPAAQILKNGYYWMVDSGGVLLPMEGVREARAGLAVIRGELDNRPQDGQGCNDGGVQGALAALEAIRSPAVATSLPVTEVVISKPEYLDRLSQPNRSRPRLEIMTSSGLTILWGTAGDDFPGELKDGEKVALLRQLLAENRVDAARQQLDVRTRVAGISVSAVTP